MPNRWPIASGNWSDPTIWNGSLIPTDADDVFTNNRRVNIDTNVTIRSIQNSATGSAIASAAQANCFYLNDGVTLTATVGGVRGNVGNASYYPTIIVSGSSSATIVSNVTVTNGNNCCAIITFDGCSLTITGSLDGGTSGVSGTNTRVLWSLSSGSLNITGSINGGRNTSAGGTIYLSSPTRTNIVGNIIGPTNIGGPAIVNASAGSVTITGSVQGSNVRADNTIVNSSIGTLIISGSVQSGNIAAAAVASSTNGTIIVYGPISSSITATGVQSTGTAATNLFTGPFYNTGSFNAVYAYRMQVFNQPTRWTFDTEVAGVQKTLTTIESITGAPASSDVRQGVAYGLNGNLTGSLIIPDSSTVKQGVPVDITTGSAVFTAQDMFNVLTQNITPPGSIGELLTRASTVQTVGSTISTFRI